MGACASKSHGHHVRGSAGSQIVGTAPADGGSQRPLEESPEGLLPAPSKEKLASGGGEKEKMQSRANHSSDSWDSSEDVVDLKGGVGDHLSNGKGNLEQRFVDAKAPEVPALSHMTSSKLEQQERRRLSVSTVEAGAKEGESVVGRSHAPLVVNISSKNNSKTDASASALLNVGTAGVQSTKPRRSFIKKFTDPALQLVDERRGAIKEVTPSMILDLVPDAQKTVAIFGSPSWQTQKGFDNKNVEVVGTSPHKKSLAEYGVGYSCKKGLKPESPNQDDFFVLRIDDWSLYGVFDGHGPCGHDVSHFVHTTLPFLVMSDPQFETDPAATFRRAFKKVHHLLEAAAEQPDAYLDCTLSGTTGSIVLHRDGKLVIGHVGDSRAVLAEKDGNGKFTAQNLTDDHKPTRDEERSRIEAHGGEVRRLEGDIPYRVFVRNRMYPGLAMSRAIGDTVGAAVGVVADPDIRITEVKVNENPFFIVATDGVWEFISSQEAIDFCSKKSRKQVQEASDFLAYESWRRWVEEEENVVDDVTCIVVWTETST